MCEGGRQNPNSDVSGFTLIEVLVVVAILGLIAAILTVAVSNAIKRQRLDTAAQQLRSFMDRAYVSTTQTGNGMFVQIGAVRTDGSRSVRLVEDSNSNRTLDSTDQVLATETITNDLVLSNSSTAATAWPVVSGSLEMLCDSMGRAIDPTTGRQITGDLTISLTHTDMTGSGTLTPRLRYDIRLYPLWSPSLTEVRL
jgi:prepilin-type N-terminal cleavage/methylation domain-containing protein